MADKEIFKKHKNYCNRLYKRERKTFYNNIDLKNITDNNTYLPTLPLYVGVPHLVLISRSLAFSSNPPPPPPPHTHTHTRGKPACLFQCNVEINMEDIAMLHSCIFINVQITKTLHCCIH